MLIESHIQVAYKQEFKDQISQWIALIPTVTMIAPTANVVTVTAHTVPAQTMVLIAEPQVTAT